MPAWVHPLRLIAIYSFAAGIRILLVRIAAVINDHLPSIILVAIGLKVSLFI